jgi:hypothetical protein
MDLLGPTCSTERDGLHYGSPEVARAAHSPLGCAGAGDMSIAGRKGEIRWTKPI